MTGNPDMGHLPPAVIFCGVAYFAAVATFFIDWRLGAALTLGWFPTCGIYLLCLDLTTIPPSRRRKTVLAKGAPLTVLAAFHGVMFFKPGDLSWAIDVVGCTWIVYTAGLIVWIWYND